MFIMSTWSLIDTFKSYTFKNGAFVMPAGTNVIVPTLSVIYIVLAIWVLIECVPVIARNAKHSAASLAK
jgi:carbon starvation protein